MVVVVDGSPTGGTHGGHSKGFAAVTLASVMVRNTAAKVNFMFNFDFHIPSFTVSYILWLSARPRRSCGFPDFLCALVLFKMTHVSTLDACHGCDERKT